MNEVSYLEHSAILDMMRVWVLDHTTHLLIVLDIKYITPLALIITTNTNLNWGSGLRCRNGSAVLLIDYIPDV